jgi:2-oxo-4-hydroxy-4-carboxy--5-ureidoimidazoline (OHCU) decarboxylase
MKRSDIDFLKQLINSFETAEFKLENAYKRGDFATFNKMKKFMLQMQEKISEIIK